MTIDELLSYVQRTNPDMTKEKLHIFFYRGKSRSKTERVEINRAKATS